jgi:hypothetical protein
VARFASLREARRYVIWVGCALEVGHMASDAGCAVQGVIVFDMAIGTLSWRNRVRSRKREVHR